MNNRNQKLNTRRLAKTFQIICEGKVTEPTYFAMIRRFVGPNVNLKVKPGGTRGSNSSPHGLVKYANDLLDSDKEYSETWIIFDKDNWTTDQIAKVRAWAQKSNSYQSAISDPKFEFWLMLHFENGTSVQTARDVDQRLKKAWPEYDKFVPANKFSLPEVEQAISRAKTIEKNSIGTRLAKTEVFRLIESLLSASHIT